MKELHLLFNLFILFCLASCFSEEKTVDYAPHETLEVAIDILDSLLIEKIILKTSAGTDSLVGKALGKHRRFNLQVPLKGEGIFSVVVITDEDTIYSQEIYAEGGYRPVVTLENGKINVIKWF